MAVLDNAAYSLFRLDAVDGEVVVQGNHNGDQADRETCDDQHLLLFFSIERNARTPNRTRRDVASGGHKRLSAVSASGKTIRSTTRTTETQPTPEGKPHLTPKVRGLRTNT